jgi:hypothetical protein
VDEQELQAVVEARKELGPEHEEHLIQGFLDRIEKEIDRRVDQRVAERVKTPRRRGPRNFEAELGIFVPIFLFAGIFGGATGILYAAVALAVVFIISLVTR